MHVTAREILSVTAIGMYFLKTVVLSQAVRVEAARRGALLTWPPITRRV